MDYSKIPPLRPPSPLPYSFIPSVPVPYSNLSIEYQTGDVVFSVRFGSSSLSSIANSLEGIGFGEIAQAMMAQQPEQSKKILEIIVEKCQQALNRSNVDSEEATGE